MGASAFHVPARERRRFTVAEYHRMGAAGILADASLQRDREVKAPLCAAAGIMELWIVDLAAGRVEVLREPGQGGYGLIRRFGSGDTLTPMAFANARFAVADLLPLPAE